IFSWRDRTRLRRQPSNRLDRGNRSNPDWSGRSLYDRQPLNKPKIPTPFVQQCSRDNQAPKKSEQVAKTFQDCGTTSTISQRAKLFDPISLSVLIKKQRRKMNAGKI